MINPGYPNYVNSGVGLPVFRAPFMQKDAKLAFFMLSAEYDNLKALCDKYINDPMGPDSEWRYIPLAPLTILIYADMIVYSENKADRNVGWMNERDVSFWIPVLAQKRHHGEYHTDHIAFFLPYLYVDNPYAISTGREVFGFRKTLATFDMPKEISDPVFQAHTLAFKTLSAETHAKVQWLMKVEHDDAEPSSDKPTLWQDGKEAAQAIIQLLANNEKGIVENKFIKEIINLFLYLVKPEIPFVFLKQFRDIENTDKASLQAIVEAPAIAQKFHGGGLYQYKYRLHLNQLESHPLAQELGLHVDENNTQAVSAGFWMTVDFPVEAGTVMWQAKPKPQKVAILGGGTGSLATAYALTSQPNWQQKYDITVYQMGWRLGGKGASGRRQDKHDRIEEHGIHLWMGFYDNSFNMLQACYEELNRPPDAPLATWQEAFQPQNYIVTTEFHDGQWKPWGINFPTNDGIPGDGSLLFSAWEYFQKLLSELHKHVENSPYADITTSEGHLPDFVHHILGHMDIEVEGVAMRVLGKLIAAAKELAHKLHADPKQHHPDHHKVLDWLLKEFLAAMRHLFSADMPDDIRRFFLVLELAAVNAWGMIVDGVILEGFNVIETVDYRAWLRKHGASDTVANSVITRAYYDLIFAYVDGETGSETPSHEGNVGAGTALHSLLLLTFSYKGSIMWKMKAGMGDVVFAPLYQALKKRGVKFEFFHKVKELVPGKTNIEQIVIERQATCNSGHYEPLFDVKGLPCWPSNPLYDQLVQGETLKAEKINLESNWTPWQGVGTVTLTAGQDFDLVVLGISIGALKTICKPLIDSNDAWKKMVDNVLTVQTQGVQLWLDKDLKALGWEEARPILDAYIEPLNTWSDMTQTLPSESWPEGKAPKSVAYFCGPMKNPLNTPPPSNHGFPGRELKWVEANAHSLLNNNMKLLWPNGMSPKNPNRFDWSMVMDSYFRANIDPTERYVLSVAGSYQYRLKAGESGYGNLYLAGDWIDNEYLNVGAIEPAVVSGFRASQAISGHPRKIMGAD